MAKDDSTSNVMGKRSAIDFYEMLLRTGKIKKGGSAYQRYLVLKGLTEQDRINRLNNFLRKRRAKNEQNGRVT